MEKVKKVRKAFRRHFIDVLRLYVMGGTGGNGLPRYGGIGGRGGNVYVVAKEGRPSLSCLSSSSF